MLTVSLHGIRLHAPYGLYEQEHVLGNEFEVDVDVWAEANMAQPWPFIDYTRINAIVHEVFAAAHQLLEALTRDIYEALKRQVPEASRIRIAVRKLQPPMEGRVRYSQVCFEG